MLAIFGVTAGVARNAEACSPPLDLSLFPELDESSARTLPTDGVLAFTASATGELDDILALLTIEVTADDVPVTGTIETIELYASEGFGVVNRRLIIVWRPDAPLAPGIAHVATLAVADSHAPELEAQSYQVAITTAEGPAGALPQPTLAEPALEAIGIVGGRQVCCEIEGGCGESEGCVGTQRIDVPGLAADITPGSDPLLSQVYLRSRIGIDGATEVADVLGIGDAIGEVTLSPRFEGPASSYCVGIEVVSLIDGSVSEPVVHCVDHGGLELGVHDNNEGVEGFLLQCTSDPYWEDTNEPYEPSTGESGESGESSEGGSAESGGSADESGSEGGQDGGESDVGDRGCACDAGGERSFVPGLLVLGLGLGLRRRRAKAV